MPPDISFAANLRAARARANINQTQLARLCGYGQTNISKWDTGKSTPTVEQLLVIAAALGTTAADLVAGLTLTPPTTPPPGRTTAAKRISPQRNGPDGPPLVTRRQRRQAPIEAP